ncbi:MAG: hypothetical protein ACRCYQ_06655 [Nocardioides sp.]
MIPSVLAAEPAAPSWVDGVRRADAVGGLTGVDWMRRPSPEFVDQVVQ